MNMSTPLQKPAGQVVKDNTKNTAGVLATLVILNKVAQEHGLDAGVWFDPNWIGFLTDPEVVIIGTGVTIWLGNWWRSSNLHWQVRELRSVFDRWFRRKLDLPDNPTP